ncbi:hypothetical protein IKD67_04145 [Candidatus Saccharibacteria bacterium]|nr:hypothetical protein [Candidatus Saccharibacteria bacterium]
MDQNQVTDQTTQSSVDNDLQKAIDDIANNTNVDPVFSDPVAAPSSVPEGDTGELGEPVGPFPEPKVEMPAAPATEPIAPLESMNIPEINNFNADSEPNKEEVPATEQPAAEAEQPTTETTTEPTNAAEVKKAALRDLFPLIGKININKSQKFNIYKDIFEELKDYSVLEPAYQAARELDDETERAEALLYLVEAIDKM